MPLWCIFLVGWGSTKSYGIPVLFDIFSGLDLGDSGTFFSCWADLFLVFITFVSFWGAPSLSDVAFKRGLAFLFSSAQPVFRLNGFLSVLTALITIIVTVGLGGLTPYIYSAPTHLLFTLALSAPLWLALGLSSLSGLYIAGTAMYMAPGGPSWLSNFLGVVEVLSACGRPLILGFRLAANLSSGAIIMCLAGVSIVPCLMAFPAFFGGVLYVFTICGGIIAEGSICLLQAYVFYTLFVLYCGEHPS